MKKFYHTASDQYYFGTDEVKIDGVILSSGWLLTASDEDLANKGFTPVEVEADLDTRFWRLVGTTTTAGVETKLWEPLSLPELKSQFKIWLDLVAGQIRSSYLVGDYIETEYYLARDEAQAFKAQGYGGTVPASVQTWALASQRSPTEAADDILATAEQFYQVLQVVRHIRLVGKADIEMVTSVEDLERLIKALEVDISRIRRA